MVILRDDRGRFAAAPPQQPLQQQQQAPIEQQQEQPGQDQPPAVVDVHPPQEQQQQQDNEGILLHQQPANLQPPGNADDIAHLHQAIQGLLALTQQQQAAIDLLQQGAHLPRQHLRASVKLPPFSCNNPQLWFDQVEAQFRLYGVVDEASKFSLIVGQLDEQGAREIEDIIRRPPINAPYTTLKDALINRVAVSEQQRIRQLLTGEELGDRTPSQFLRQLRSLSCTVPDHLLRTLWSQRLPTHVQAIIQSHAVNPAVTTDHLAAIADKVLEVSPTVSTQLASIAGAGLHASNADAPTSAAVNAVESASSTSARLDDIARQFASIQSTLQSLTRRTRFRSKTPPPHRSSSNSSARSNDTGEC